LNEIGEPIGRAGNEARTGTPYSGWGGCRLAGKGGALRKKRKLHLIVPRRAKNRKACYTKGEQPKHKEGGDFKGGGGGVRRWIKNR